MDFDDMNIGNQGDDGGSLFWDIFKLVAFVIGAVILLRLAFGLVWGLLPFIIVAGLLFAGYKMFIEDDSSQVGTTEDPALLEEDLHSETAPDDILDEDPLEKEFEELEQRDSST